MESVVVQYAPSIIMIIIGLFLTNQDRLRNKSIETHQTQLSNMFSQMASCIIANNEGTMALARCVKDRDLNGGLTAAMEKIAKTNEKYNELLLNLAANNLAKR